MSELSRLLGAPQVWEFEGRPYKVAPCTLEIEAAFEAWLEQNAQEAIERGRARLGDAWADRATGVWLEACAGDVYCFGGPTWEKSIRTLAGQKQLAFLRISKMHPDFDAAVLGRAKDDAAAWGRLLRIVIAGYFVWGTPDPKEQAAPPPAESPPADCPPTSGG